MKDKGDHDILIGLVKTVENNHLVLMDKINDVKGDVKEVRDGTVKTLTEHDLRLKALEEITKTSTSPQRIEQHDVMWQERYNDQFRRKFFITVYVAIGGLIIFILQRLTEYFGWFKH